jgi:hypothetical protein
LEVQQVNNVFYHSAVFDFLIADSLGENHSQKWAIFNVDVPGGHEIIEGGQPCEELDMLKSSADAQPCSFVGVQSGDVLSPEMDTPFLRPVKSRDAIKGTCFTRAIRPDEGQDFMISQVKIQIT